MVEEFFIREATLLDLAALHTLNTNELGYDYPIEKAKNQLLQLLEDQRHHLLAVAENSQHEILGYLHAEVYQEIYADSALNILALAVNQSAQGQGIGTALIEWLEEAGKNRKIRIIRLNSGANRQDAHAFYRHLGFEEVKTQKKFVLVSD
ncbi:GNAT family N-acetyltransferase [Fructobacillus evanidus]|uniref:Ribosomal protein S18 acetylase RimI and related acetyltransferases (RimI) n=1 Tax=Fructobacillus evanidus TaxID=3064281 RepID=A0ABM9MXQ2_9LACO|nr:Ribosomal protein S18 acetylase RimI and related acetyltransferases (RimI) [Fructobacillus sp. LMG 32999]CAK1230108.1 Ribosomal protein S18 acetylase RimI and related acetyltransferases (RimI) [Fructobacillus sp. LMG 32999]CAK1230447.1 Ribosomal protein S18 acetylase RimI and related acetyltransferases (RimI) [Fructobacillus sp. LMG 32999]CAK1231329.1 Ribosomal protein S18 acetylase RimI and related acetyltransferases (RimI) [Fructobacillus sp. LMG 32999]CAK1239936.1 Ribosomal protein S18 ac